MKPSEQLQAAKELIKDPGNWIKGQFRDLANKKFCMIGSLHQAAPTESIGKSMDFLSLVIPEKKIHCIPDFNDHPDTAHADVMKVFDDAIVLAKEAEDGVEVLI
jgi:hypothetical protein